MDSTKLVIPGFDEVEKQFGRWPSFHDAIVERFMLDLQGISLISLRTWNTSNELDAQGYFRTTDHATVDFVLNKISAFELSGSDLYAGGILFGLRLASEGEEFRLEFDPVLGTGGWISCKNVRLELRNIGDTKSLDQEPTIPSL